MSKHTNEPDKLKTLRRQRYGAGLVLLLLIVGMVTLMSVSNAPDWLAVALILLLLAELVFILILNVRIRRVAKAAASSSPAPRPIPSLRLSLILSLFWFVLDALYFQQGIVSATILLLCILWMGPSAFMARKDKALRRFRAGRASAYFLAAVAALGAIRANSYLAKRSAEVVITAVRQYHQKYGHYPERLQDVTPEFIHSIPLARYSFAWNRFSYFKAGETPQLYYMVYPPFLRNVYSFETGTWHQMD